MDEYISKEIAIERIKRIKPHVVMSEYGVGYERGLKDAIGILNATPAADVQPVNQWISVKDRLPDEGASVLICTNEGIRSVSARYGNRFFITIVEAFTEDTVTHWQPLPEPPKDGDT